MGRFAPNYTVLTDILVAGVKLTVSPVGSVGASACSRGVHWTPAPLRMVRTATKRNIENSGAA